MDPLSQLTSIALSWLAHPEQIPGWERPGYACLRVRLWHYPALRGPHVSLVLYEADARRFSPHGKSTAVEVVWDRAKDVLRLSPPNVPTGGPMHPSITFRQVLVPTDVVTRRYEALQQLVFRPFSRSGIGTDGFRRGVEARLGMGTTSIEWWANPPPGFEPLVAWYEETWNELQREMSTGPQAS